MFYILVLLISLCLSDLITSLEQLPQIKFSSPQLKARHMKQRRKQITSIYEKELYYGARVKDLSSDSENPRSYRQRS